MAKVKFEELVASFSYSDRHTFNIKDKPGSEYDYVNTYLVPIEINFGGIPAVSITENICESYEIDDEKLVNVASLSGYLILCNQMLKDGYDPLEVCDDHSGDLEYALSALMDDGEPLNINPWQDVFYIDELTIQPEHHTQTLFNRILKELPFLIKEFAHVVPNILAYYLSPIRSNWEPEDEDRNMDLRHLAVQKVSGFIDGVPLSQQNSSDNVLSLPVEYQFSDDEIKMIMGSRYSKSGYPEELKNQKILALYSKNGFHESGESRLFYKPVRI